jgi:homoserine dehydrogenase
VTVDVVRVGLLGAGTVGRAVIRLIDANAAEIEMRAGIRLEIVRIAVREPARARATPLDAAAVTADPFEVVADPDVDVVCELMGGVEPARRLVLEAFEHGKPVVTANKELLATHGRELFEAASAKALDLEFEAAVGGGVPLVRPLRESLAGERVTRFMGILNGTTNLILTRMAEDGLPFADALAEAQRLGYAEADPSADVDGHDAAAKCAILATIAFDSRVLAPDVFREGISAVTTQDIELARRLGYVVKLLAVAELEDGMIAARVHPAMIPVEHPLASVRGSFNAVFVEGERVGELMFYGRGAGGDPTATAVVGDLVAVARRRLTGGRPVLTTAALDRPISPIERMENEYYLLLDVEDRPGVLGEIAAVFGVHAVSIRHVWQEGSGDDAQLVFVTHRATEGSVQAAAGELASLRSVRAVESVLRVEGEE